MPTSSSSRAAAIRAEVAGSVRLAIPVVAAQVGMVLMGSVDTAMLGHFSAEAPLTARVRLALAEAHAGLADSCTAEQQHLAAACALYALAPSPAETVGRAWTEARIATLAQRPAEAQVLFDNARWPSAMSRAPSTSSVRR